MAFREMLPGPNALALIHEQEKRRLRKYRLSCERIARIGATSNAYFDFDYLIQDPNGCERIVTQLASKVNEVSRIRHVDLLAFIEKADGGTVGALPLEAAISIYTHLPTVHVRLSRELTMERVKAHLEQDVPANKRLQETRLMVITDHISSGGEVLKAVNAIQALGGEVTDIVCYTAYPDRIKWDNFNEINIHYLYSLQDGIENAANTVEQPHLLRLATG